jgi:hypothetical protein
MTYLWWQKRGSNMVWKDRVDARGYLWATPDKYLRKSMMVNVARKISDYRGPEDFWETTTFDEAEGPPSRSQDEENVLAMRLATRVNDELEPRTVKDDEEDEDDEDDEDEEDEEDEE